MVITNTISHMHDTNLQVNCPNISTSRGRLSHVLPCVYRSGLRFPIRNLPFLYNHMVSYLRF